MASHFRYLLVPITYTCSIERRLWIFRDCIDDSCWDRRKPACMCLRTPVWNSGRSDCGGLPIFQCCVLECVPCQHFDCFWFLHCYYSGQWLWVHYFLVNYSSDSSIWFLWWQFTLEMNLAIQTIATLSQYCPFVRCWSGSGEVRVQPGRGDLTVGVCSLL